MPKRALPAIAVAPVDTLVPPPPPSPLVQKLRQDYRWAAISEFCFTFSDAFGSLNLDIEVSLCRLITPPCPVLFVDGRIFVAALGREALDRGIRLGFGAKLTCSDS